MLQRLGYKLQAFMYGRNGADQLSWALLILGVVLSLAASFTGWSILSLLSYVPMFAALYRMFSKNIPQRQKENAWLLRLLHRENRTYSNGYQQGNYYYDTSTARPRPRSVSLKDRMKDKEHRYFRCPSCRQTVRVPRGKGVIRITCPKCGERFEHKT